MLLEYLLPRPVFSYYEFKQPMDDRLTDEAWREMLTDSLRRSRSGRPAFNY